MSNENGTNKRTVKKTNKGNKTVNIKVSTQDIDEISKINNTIDTSNDKKKTNKIRYLSREDDEDVDVFTKTKNLEKQLKYLKLEMNNTAKEEFQTIESLNQTLSELEKKQSEVNKENVKLLTKFKGIEKEVSTKFDNKFKLAKIVTKEKEKATEQTLGVQIKARTQQVNTMQKNIDRSKKEMKVIEKKLKQSGEGGKLNQELININKQIEDFQKDIIVLKEIEIEHLRCEKERAKLTTKYNILLNEKDFENKIKDMPVKPKIKPTKIRMTTESMSYGEELRKKQLSKVKEKYNAKKNLVKYRLFNKLSNNLDEKNEKIETNKSLSRNNKNNLNNSNINNNNLRTSANIDYGYQLVDVSSKIDSSSPKNFLFSEKEKEVLNALVPEGYMKNFNERYNNIENQINQIENEKTAEYDKKKNEIDNCKIQIDVLKLKNKEQEIKIMKKNTCLQKNRREISNYEKKIRDTKDEIKATEKHLKRISKMKEGILEIIERVKQEKRQQTMKREEEGEEEEFEGEEEGEEEEN